MTCVPRAHALYTQQKEGRAKKEKEEETMKKKKRENEELGRREGGMKD